MEKKSIYDCYQEIKQREINELRECVMAAGGSVVFKKNRPSVCCNFDYGPSDIDITTVEIKDDIIVITGYDSEAGQDIDVELDDIIYSHIDFITSEIRRKK